MAADFDAIVIGAGPAGAMAAWEFANAGWRVLLLDRHHFPREKACGGALTQRAMHALPFPVDRHIERFVTCQATNALTDSAVFNVLPRSRLYMTRRCVFDAVLVEQAVARGAHFRSGEAVQRVVDSGMDVTVGTAHGEYRARCAVLACGAGLGLSEEGRIKALARPAAFALEGRIDVDVLSVPPALMQIAEFDYRYPAAGYAWVFPNRNSLNIGIGTFDLENVAVSKADLCRHFDTLASRLGGNIVGVRGAPVGIGGLSYVPRGRVFYAGDVAGFTSSSSGEGIASALVSGRLVAIALIKSGAALEGAGMRYSESLRPIRKWLQASFLEGGRLYGI